MKKFITPYAVLVYFTACVIASSGAINHGFDNHEHIFSVAGILNLVFAGWTVWKIWKSQN